VIGGEQIPRFGGQQAFLLVGGTTNSQDIERGLPRPLGMNLLMVGPCELLVSNIEPQRCSRRTIRALGKERAIRRTVSTSIIRTEPIDLNECNDDLSPSETSARLTAERRVNRSAEPQWDRRARPGEPETLMLSNQRQRP
jgi:hypothetical protein